MKIDYHNTDSDALTEVLEALQIEGRIYCVNDMKTPWAIDEERRDQIYFYVIENGSGQLKLKNRGREISFDDGDLILVASGEDHLIYNGSPENPVLNSRFFGENRKERHYLRIEGGGDEKTSFICGAFFFKYTKENALRAALPPVIHLRAAEPGTAEWLAPLLAMLSRDARKAEVGAGAVINRLTEIIFVQAVRHWIKTHKNEQTGWLAALNDEQVSRALNLLHQNPGKNWTVAAIAAKVGMSRSPFAAKFTSLVGEPPLKYLTKWRLNLAAGYLRSNELSVAEISGKVGYETSQAFGKNFKRYFGVSPREFRESIKGGVEDKNGSSRTVRSVKPAAPTQTEILCSADDNAVEGAG